MNSYTAEAYRAAAEIARRSGGLILPGAADAWEKKAEKMDKLAEYGVSLVDRVREMTTGEYGGYRSPEDTGMAIVSTLLQDGWTAPEGLF